ncbi:hypothetical protein BFP76_12690 [Amylibacter kogurei]|uniref:Uncharacterized protein n=1 Tax=Paramylibacter kogurei TaxID=1889778 RepID=A0A2G5KB47_9RHOB|nr:indolepyruvate oxidoreductase subunit beta family protein [Amylibacter kogurei]PIB25854.1 hypothetical protein BFP76_12690 [Amylibacter kogurei]
MNNSDKTLRILIAALGGQGGGTLMNWIVSAARQNDFHVQATSVPGVAQRTGSTSYYIEISPDKNTVLGLVPMPARVDVVLSSELIETARMMDAGFVSPNRTTLITSSSRVFSTAEKINLGDGRFDASAVKEAAQVLAKTCHSLDLEQLANDHKTFISATMFGALAGSGVLPWPADKSRAILETGGKISPSLAGFDATLAALQLDALVNEFDDETEQPSITSLSGFEDCAPALREVITLGYERTIDFQDAEYGALYLTRCKQLIDAARSDHTAQDALTEACRRLALWMAYEDTARVADLKTRASRFETIRKEAEIKDGQVFRITEYLKPRAEEIADVMPRWIGERIMKRATRGGWFPFIGRGIYIRSNGIVGYWLLRTMAAFKHIRRKSLRYHVEQEAIENWLAKMAQALRDAPDFAGALAQLPRVLKGYSDTQQRGKRAFDMIMADIVKPAMDADLSSKTPSLRGAIAAALADENHKSFDQFMQTGEIEIQPPTLARKPAHAH